MRLISKVPSHPQYKRLMLYQAKEGVFLFLYNTEMDAPCIHDLWFEDLQKAYEYSAEVFGISNREWKAIPDPMPNCLDDCIQPVRIRGQEIGSPEKITLEKLVDGKWIDYSP